MKGMKCGKKSAQKLISEIEKEKIMLIDWLLKTKFSESDWKSGNEWKVNIYWNYDNEWNVNWYNLKNKENIIFANIFFFLDGDKKIK